MKKLNTSVEAAFPLTLALIKEDLAEAREKKIKVDGYVNFDKWGRGGAFDYFIENYDQEDLLTINYGEKGQTVKIVQIYLHFGFRTLFVCECMRRCVKLYLPLGEDKFMCRYCHSLYYNSTRKSSSIKRGGKFYLMQQALDLDKLLEKIHKRTYRGEYTRKCARWIKLNKAFHSAVSICRDEKAALEAKSQLSRFS